MVRRVVLFLDLKEDFRTWLINRKGLSKKVAGDVICRCKRLDNEVLDSLEFSISSVDNYLLAMGKINQYSSDKKIEPKARYALSCCLRSAMRKYCEFRHPDDISHFPNAYNLKF